MADDGLVRVTEVLSHETRLDSVNQKNIAPLPPTHCINVGCWPVSPQMWSVELPQGTFFIGSIIQIMMVDIFLAVSRFFTNLAPRSSAKEPSPEGESLHAQ